MPSPFSSRPVVALNGREEAKQECDPEDGQIRPEIQNEREVYVIKQSREGVQQEIITPHTEDEADDAATNREQQTFREQLLDDLPA